MEIDELFEMQGFPKKWAETHIWVRDMSDGDPQIIRVEPFVNSEGEFMPHNVRLYIDEKPPTIMARCAAENMLAAQNCVPIEYMMNWKHMMRN